MPTPYQQTQAQKLYGAPDTSQAPSKPPAVSPKRVYQKHPYGASIEWAVCSTFDRLESRVRSDPERLGQLRATRKAVTQVLEERAVDPVDAHLMLSRVREHLARPLSTEAQAKRWPMEWERIRLAAGSTAAGAKVIEDAQKFYQALKAADPAFASTVAESGAGQDAQVLQVAAKYSESSTAKE